MSQSTLKSIANPPERVKAFGREYAIKQFTLGQVAKALEFIGPVGLLLQSLASLPKNERGEPQSSNDVIFPMVQALAFSGDSLIGLISIATSEPREWLEEQEPMEGVELLAKVIQHNLPLFSVANVARVKVLFGELQSAIQTHGGASSTTSSATDMDRSNES